MRFASLLVYTPWRRDPDNLGSGPRQIMFMVKGARPDALERVAIRCSELRDTGFGDFFTPDSTLVPVPTSAPAKAPDTLWPGLSIAEALLRQGLARDVQKLLVRTVRVPKAHDQSATDRPRIDEMVDSLEWKGDLGSSLERIILVDDVITRGTTFLAAREVIRRAQPWLEVEGFAAVRTMSFEVVTEPLDPAVGVTEPLAIVRIGRAATRYPLGKSRSVHVYAAITIDLTLPHRGPPHSRNPRSSLIPGA